MCVCVCVCVFLVHEFNSFVFGCVFHACFSSLVGKESVTGYVVGGGDGGSAQGVGSRVWGSVG